MGEVAMILDGSDIISMSDIQAYADVIRSAFAVHVDREKIRHGLWKNYPAEDQANQIKIKIDRVLRSLERLSSMGQELETQERTNIMEDLQANILEELPDIINYAVFTARKLTDGDVV